MQWVMQPLFPKFLDFFLEEWPFLRSIRNLAEWVMRMRGVEDLLERETGLSG